VNRDKYLPDTEVSYAPRIAVITIATLLVGILILVWIQIMRPPVAVPRSNEVLVATPLGPADDLTVITEDDVTVYVPPKAVDMEGSISIVAPEQDQLVADDPDWTRPRVVNIEFIDADGTTVDDLALFRPIEVCFALTEEQWLDFNSRPGFYQVQHYNDQKNQPRWENLPKVIYPDRLQLCGQTYHLSLFSVAIMVEPNIPVTGPTATLTATPTSTSTARPLVQPAETRERRPSDTPVPTSPPPTIAPPTQPPPTSAPPTIAPTDPPAPEPTDPPSQPTEEPPPPPDPDPTEPEPPEPEPVEPPSSGGNNGNNGNGPPPGHGPPGGPPGQNRP